MFFLILGSIIYELSAWTVTTPHSLNPNQTIELSLLRVFPDTLNLELEFNRVNWNDLRPELGLYQSQHSDWKKTGYLDFSEPGEPIKLLVHSADEEVVYEAEPVTARGETTLYRKLLPFVDDGNPHRFQWPLPKYARLLPLKAGVTELKISVLKVGKKINGEQASLIIEAPITFKFTHMNCGFFWWFMLWPLYVIILMYLGAVLDRTSNRNN